MLHYSNTHTTLSSTLEQRGRGVHLAKWTGFAVIALGLVQVAQDARLDVSFDVSLDVGQVEVAEDISLVEVAEDVGFVEVAENVSLVDAGVDVGLDVGHVEVP